jgi:hypothetical protein
MRNPSTIRRRKMTWFDIEHIYSILEEGVQWIVQSMEREVANARVSSVFATLPINIK